MKKITFSLLLIVFAGFSLFAQNSKTTPEGRAQHDLKKVKDAFDENSSIALSAEQEQKLLASYLEKHECIQEARLTVEKDELRAEMRNCNKLANDAFQSILTEQQMERYKERQREIRMERLKKKADRGQREVMKLEEVLKGDLALTENQKKSLMRVFEEESKAYQESTSGMKDKKDFNKKRQGIKEATNEKIKSILTEDQWKAAFTTENN